MEWLKKNIKFMLSVIALFSFLSGVAVDIIPMPAKAADLDKLAATVQQLAELQIKSTKNAEIREKRAEIRAIERTFDSHGKPVSGESQRAIRKLREEIEDLKERG